MKIWRIFAFILCSIILLKLVEFSTPTAVSATVLHTADAANAIVVQSRRTIRDQDRQSWQVIAFKSVRPDAEDPPLMLRVIGFPGRPAIVHPAPGRLIDLQDQVWLLPDRSDQVTAAPVPFSLGQYDLATVLAQLPSEQRLRLQLPTADAGAHSILLPIPPALVQEWQTVAAAAADDLVNQCDVFPIEARQNPTFPLWTGCRITEKP